MLQSFNSHNIYKYFLQPSTPDTLLKSGHCFMIKKPTTCSYSSGRIISGKITKKFCWRHKYLLCQYSLMKYSATTTLQQKNRFALRNEHIHLRNLGNQGWVVVIQAHVIQRKSVGGTWPPTPDAPLAGFHGRAGSTHWAGTQPRWDVNALLTERWREGLFSYRRVSWISHMKQWWADHQHSGILGLWQ